MSTEIIAFEPEHLPLVAQFARAVWPRPRSDAWLRWRYLDHPSQRAWLAVREGRCLAMMTAFLRPYASGAQEIVVTDSFDWYCLPELRNSGLGVRIMQRAMKDAEPVVVTGGTPDTRAFLPRMGFQTAAEVQRFVLALAPERTADALARRGVPRSLGLLAFRAAQPFLAPRRRAVPRGARVLAVASVGPEALAIDPRPDGRGSAPIWTSAYLHWLGSGFPGIGHYLPLYFTIADELVGWALLRFFDTSLGSEVALLDLRARTPDAALYTWMVSEVAVRAAADAPGFLTAGTTCPELAAGLRRNHFRPVGSAPIHWYAKQHLSLEAPIVFGSHWGDEPLVPYPTHWWEPGAKRRIP